jgi:hypothetical protein
MQQLNASMASLFQMTEATSQDMQTGILSIKRMIQEQTTRYGKIESFIVSQERSLHDLEVSWLPHLEHLNQETRSQVSTIAQSLEQINDKIFKPKQDQKYPSDLDPSSRKPARLDALSSRSQRKPQRTDGEPRNPSKHEPEMQTMLWVGGFRHQHPLHNFRLNSLTS